MGATEYEALNELFKLPNTEVRMELNAESTRLHAKSYIFNKPDGHSVAFVGSANISKAALTEGEEWVVKLFETDVPEVLLDLRTSYEALWNSGNVKPVSQRNRADIEYALERRGS
jgi:HKD family nuclease